MDNYHGELDNKEDNNISTATHNSTAPEEIKDLARKQEILSKYPYVVCLVYATWCGPCTAFKPIFAKYASDNVSKAFFCQENAELRLTEGIRGIPTVVVYKNRNIIERVVGGDTKRLDEILPPL